MKPLYSALLTSSRMMITALNLGAFLGCAYSMEKETEILSTARRAQPNAVFQQGDVHILSAEGAEVQQKLNLIAVSHPHIAQPIPNITSQQDYQIAKEYITLLEKKVGVLKRVALSHPTQAQPLLDSSGQVLTFMQSYVATLLSPEYDSYRMEDEQKTLEDFSYSVLYRQGENHLFTLIRLVRISEALARREATIQAHVKAIKDIKEQLSPSPRFRKEFRTDLENAQEMLPSLRLVLNPERAKHTPQITSRKLPPRITNRKQASSYHKQLESVAPLTFACHSKEGFDLYFHLTTQKLLTDELLYSTRRMPYAEYCAHLQQLWQSYRKLEQEGYELGESLEVLPPRSSSTGLTIENLTDLYRFFRQRYTFLPDKDPIILVEHIIFILIQTNQLAEALTHTEVLGNLLTEKGAPLPDKFISLRANILALNGQIEEWVRLKESKDTVNQARKKRAHQEHVTLLKGELELQKEKERLEAEAEAKRLQEISRNPKKPLSAPPSMYEFPTHTPKEQPAPEVSPVRPKVKTRKTAPGVLPPDKETNQPVPLSAEVEKQSVKKYNLSKSALKVYRKIRQGDRNFSRQNLFNLFEKLGCKPVLSQGKGDHGKIPAPLTMTIHSQDKVVGIIPEFTVKRYQATPFPLTVPNWDEKWDGMVPHYMMKSIVAALNFIGVTDESVS